MRITFRKGIYYAIANFDEKPYLKAAGFGWHPGLNECPRGPASCAACRVGLRQGWWTRRHESAARLAAHADDLAQAAMAKHLQAVQMSRATDADLYIPSPKNLEYLGYQKAGIHYMSQREGTLLGDQPGLGKTIQILGLINFDKTIERTLIICPASLRINWKREAQKWLVADDRRWLIHVVDEDKAIPERANFVIVHYNRVTIGFKRCDGPCKGERRKALECPRCKGTGNGKKEPLLCDFCKGKKTVVCSKCNGRGRFAASNLKIVESLNKRPWDLVAADECHFLKSESAKRTKAVLGDRINKKPGLADLGRIRVFMSGTPIPNRPIEIWPIISALAPDEFGNFKVFAKRYCEGHEEYVSKTKKVFVFDGASNLEELQERLRSICMIRRLKEDVLKELPPKRRQIISLPPSEDALNMIAQEQKVWEEKFGDELSLVEAAISTAEENKDTGGYTAAVDKLQYIQRVAFVEMASMRKKVAIVKAPLVIEHLKSMFDEGVKKIVCFAHHKEVIQKIHAKFPDISVMAYGEISQDKRQRAVDLFQDKHSHVKLFIGGITAVGVGITLTASSNVVFAELDWTPGNVHQAEDRCHRIGQVDSVLVQHLVLDGSLDARMAQMIVEKQEVADRALDSSTDVAVKGLVSVRPELPSEPVELWKKILAKEALIELAKRRDPTVEDGNGFSRFDSPIGQSLATKTKAFSDKEAHLALKLVNKYKRQLSIELLDRLGIERPEDPKSKGKKKYVPFSNHVPVTAFHKDDPTDALSMLKKITR